MGLFSDIEKLINEHGSAVILKERLTLAAEKYAALEQKVSDLTGENAILQSQLESATNQNRTLQDQVSLLSKKELSLTEDEVRILIFLSKRDKLTDREISAHLQIHLEKVKFYLDELSDKAFVWSQGIINQPPNWSLDKEGRRYLITSGSI